MLNTIQISTTIRHIRWFNNQWSRTILQNEHHTLDNSRKQTWLINLWAVLSRNPHRSHLFATTWIKKKKLATTFCKYALINGFLLHDPTNTHVMNSSPSTTLPSYINPIYGVSTTNRKKISSYGAFSTQRVKDDVLKHFYDFLSFRLFRLPPSPKQHFAVVLAQLSARKSNKIIASASSLPPNHNS